LIDVERRDCVFADGRRYEGDVSGLDSTHALTAGVRGESARLLS
jgi:hypothetical protein